MAKINGLIKARRAEWREKKVLSFDRKSDVAVKNCKGVIKIVKDKKFQAWKEICDKNFPRHTRGDYLSGVIVPAGAWLLSNLLR